MKAVALTIAQDGSVALPSDMLEHMGWRQGEPFIVRELEHGIVVSSRSAIHRAIAAQLDGHDLLGELFLERRMAAEAEERGE